MNRKTNIMYVLARARARAGENTKTKTMKFGHGWLIDEQKKKEIDVKKILLENRNIQVEHKLKFHRQKHDDRRFIVSLIHRHEHEIYTLKKQSKENDKTIIENKKLLKETNKKNEILIKKIENFDKDKAIEETNKKVEKKIQTLKQQVQKNKRKIVEKKRLIRTNETLIHLIKENETVIPEIEIIEKTNKELENEVQTYEIKGFKKGHRMYRLLKFIKNQDKITEEKKKTVESTIQTLKKQAKIENFEKEKIMKETNKEVESEIQTLKKKAEIENQTYEINGFKKGHRMYRLLKFIKNQEKITKEKKKTVLECVLQ